MLVKFKDYIFTLPTIMKQQQNSNVLKFSDNILKLLNLMCVQEIMNTNLLYE